MEKKGGQHYWSILCINLGIPKTMGRTELGNVMKAILYGLGQCAIYELHVNLMSPCPQSLYIILAVGSPAPQNAEIWFAILPQGSEHWDFMRVTWTSLLEALLWLGSFTYPSSSCFSVNSLDL